jgi:hypothetical protein
VHTGDDDDDDAASADVMGREPTPPAMYDRKPRSFGDAAAGCNVEDTRPNVPQLLTREHEPSGS